MGGDDSCGMLMDVVVTLLTGVSRKCLHEAS